MVDKAAIASALGEIGASTVADARKRATAADATASAKGRVGSHSHRQLVVDGVSAAYAEGLSAMATKIRDYAGAAAPNFVDQFAEVTEAALHQILDDRLRRFRASSIHKPAQSEEEAHMGGIEDALRAIRTGAIRDLQHRVQQPEDALSWWRRSRTRDLAIAFVLGIVATIVGTYLLQVLGLSKP
jgi:hypothetical protein